MIRNNRFYSHSIVLGLVFLAANGCARKEDQSQIAQATSTKPTAQDLAATLGQNAIVSNGVPQSGCTTTKPTPTDECAAGYPGSACDCLFTNNATCGAAWDNYYWSQQPAAVQVLRTDPSQAQSLADQGYCIDVPIMYWSWDAAMTTCMRQQYGYTWVPSGNQQNIPVAPGLSFPGLPSYDPGAFPNGSIAIPAAESSCSDYVASWTTAGSSTAPTCNGHPQPVCQSGYSWVGTCEMSPSAGWDGSCVAGSGGNTPSGATCSITPSTLVVYNQGGFPSTPTSISFNRTGASGAFYWGIRGDGFFPQPGLQTGGTSITLSYSTPCIAPGTYTVDTFVAPQINPSSEPTGFTTPPTGSISCGSMTIQVMGESCS